jgi:DNA-binding NarL/FixJ family response regulator
LPHSSLTRRVEPPRKVVLKHPELWKPGFLDPLRDGVEYEVYASDDTVQGTLSLCLDLAPCVLMLDEDSIAHFQPALSGGNPLGQVSTIVVCTQTQPDSVAELLYKGSRGVLETDASSEVVRRAVDAVSRGEIWAPRSVVSSLLQKCLVQVGPNALTEREQDVLRLIGQGLTNREIGQRLHIARETVRWHIRSVYSKIGASDRLAAAMYAKQTLLWPDEHEPREAATGTDRPLA